MPRLRRPFGGAEIAACILDAPNNACCGDLAHELTIIFVFFNDVGTRSSWRCSILCRRTYLVEFRRQRARHASDLNPKERGGYDPAFSRADPVGDCSCRM
jgi:hypothetical protein